MPYSDPEKRRAWRRAHPEITKRWRLKNAETHREQEAQRRLKNTEAASEGNARWHRDNPGAADARRAVSKALRCGNLEREPCLFCDAPKVEAHHHDYSQPLSVTWLCRRHHRLIHRKAQS